ncbi:hypothetical protein LCGC14_0175700 [marine sediment metagenome]|uniref:Uncharacterized protein n=1 Tax=marine sediment metagenome TaxID=412755 RepID=A0A0F9X9N6_9ZZZZ
MTINNVRKEITYFILLVLMWSAGTVFVIIGIVNNNDTLAAIAFIGTVFVLVKGTDLWISNSKDQYYFIY